MKVRKLLGHTILTSMIRTIYKQRCQIEDACHPKVEWKGWCTMRKHVYKRSKLQPTSDNRQDQPYLRFALCSRCSPS